MNRKSFAGLLICVVIQATAAAVHAQTPPAGAAGDAAKGRLLFAGQNGGAFCMLCHGANADGGFGPDLAGRNITLEQFTRAIKQPWGLMPTFPYLSDEKIKDMWAFVQSAPKPAQPGKWRIDMPPPGGPVVQRQFISMGCGQCHGEELIHPRRDLGRLGNGVTFEEFQTIIYKTAPAQMGIFNPDRMTEPLLRDIFKFMMDEGLRVPISATIETGAAGVYTLTVWNEAIPGKGLTANEVTISVPVPAGMTVVKADGPGYQGVSTDAAKKVDTMVWKAPRYAPAEKQVYTFTLSGTPPAQGLFRGASVGWASPGTKRVPGLTLRDNRVPETGDIIVAPGLEFILKLTPPKPSAQ